MFGGSYEIVLFSVPYALVSDRFEDFFFNAGYPEAEYPKTKRKCKKEEKAKGMRLVAIQSELDPLNSWYA